MITGTIKRLEGGQEIKTEVKQPQVQKVNPTQFVMIKNAEGALTVRLEPHDFSTPARNISFKFNQERNYIPAKFAIGVFVTPSAVHQMELGYFTFENLEVLIKMAEDMGYYVPDSIKSPKVSIKEIAKAIRSGEKQALENITKNLSTKVKSDIAATAQKMYDNLNINTIKFLEDKLKVSLKPVNLSE